VKFSEPQSPLCSKIFSIPCDGPIALSISFFFFFFFFVCGFFFSLHLFCLFLVLVWFLFVMPCLRFHLFRLPFKV